MSGGSQAAIQELAERIGQADAILIGASNGLSITEGLHLFADNGAFEELFGDFKRKYGLRCILQGMMAHWSSEGEKWAFWARLIHHYCGQYRPTQVMADLKAIVGDKDYFVVTSNGECHFELCGFDPDKIYEIEGNWLTMQCARPCHDTRYPSMELAEKFHEHAKSMGASFLTAAVTAIREEGDRKVVETAKGDLSARTVILATGAHHRLLGVPGEERLTGMGVSYCATCDGAFFRDKTVAVVGGGDVAVEDAIFLARGCKKVYVIHRRDQLRAAKILQEKLLSLDNVEMKWNCVAEEILGDSQVSGVKVRDVKTGEGSELAVNGVFIAVGILPNTGFLGDFVQLDEGGYIVAGEDMKTSVPGVFAAGDVRTKALRQIITAAADGANAITSVEAYLLGR